MDRERDVVFARDLGEALRPRVVHPETALEVELAGGVASSSRSSTAASGDSREGQRAGPRRIAPIARDRTGRDVRPTGVLPFLTWHRHPSYRSARARHRPPAHRPLARSRGGGRVESRGRCGVHARRVREGLLRRAHRGRPRLSLPRSRVPHPRAATRGRPAAPSSRARISAVAQKRNPARLVIALSVAAVLAVFLCTPRSRAAARRRSLRASSPPRRGSLPRRARSAGLQGRLLRQRPPLQARGSRPHLADDGHGALQRDRSQTSSERIVKSPSRASSGTASSLRGKTRS